MTQPTDPRPTACPFAPAVSGGVWPVITDHPHRLLVTYLDRAGTYHYAGNDPRERARRFAAYRKGKNGPRYHCGIDLYGRDGDPVRAIADGVIVRNFGAFRRGVRPDGTPWLVRRILVDHGAIVVGYGEVMPIDGVPDTHTARGRAILAPEARTVVRAGEVFAAIRKQRVSSMLHLEVYRAGTTQGAQWLTRRPPVQLLDPSLLLLELARDALPLAARGGPDSTRDG